MNKKEFRQEALNRRNALSKDDRVTKSAAIFHRLQSLSCFQKAATVLLYMSFRTEVITDEILSSLLANGKKAAVPISIPHNRTLFLSEIRDIAEDFESDFYGVRIPKKDRQYPISVSDIDLVIVPGVAFSEDRYRMGYGGGYYDRFIETLRPSTPTVALAFELQIYSQIPKETHDKKMDFIITENRIL